MSFPNRSLDFVSVVSIFFAKTHFASLHKYTHGGGIVVWFLLY